MFQAEMYRIRGLLLLLKGEFLTRKMFRVQQFFFFNMDRVNSPPETNTYITQASEEHHMNNAGRTGKLLLSFI